MNRRDFILATLAGLVLAAGVGAVVARLVPAAPVIAFTAPSANWGTVQFLYSCPGPK